MGEAQQTIGVIRPEVVASKLAAIRNYEYPKLLEQITAKPRLVEMLWFIQYMSMQQGGLVKFCKEIVAQVPSRFGTDTLRGLLPGPMSLDAKLLIYDEIPARHLPPMPESEDIHLRNLIALVLGDGGRLERVTEEDVAVVAAYFATWTRETFREICCKAALEVLPGYLAELCNQIDKGFTKDHRSIFGRELWFMDEPAATLFEVMDLRAEAISKRLALTSVTKRVYDALDFAFEEKAPVKIVGNSRFGKTQSSKGYCEMRPGLVRLVSVPSSNSISDLHKAFGEALGMDVSYGSRLTRVKEHLEHIIKGGDLFFVLDESAFLVPQNYSAGTAPSRLNWVRTQIMDRGLPLAMVTTPQGFDPRVDRYVKKTGYSIEQFLGRVVRTVVLPEELTLAEMVDVARIHFPEMGTEYLEVVADLASVSENYLQAVEAIAKVSRFIARKAGRPKVTADDIQTAAADVIPQRRLTSPPAQEPEPDLLPKSPSPRRRVKAPCRTGAEPLQANGNSRGETPDLPPSSLRGAVPERDAIEPVSARS